jgi:hypothetical protein
MRLWRPAAWGRGRGARDIGRWWPAAAGRLSLVNRDDGGVGALRLWGQRPVVIVVRRLTWPGTARGEGRPLRKDAAASDTEVARAEDDARGGWARAAGTRLHQAELSDAPSSLGLRSLEGSSRADGGGAWTGERSSDVPSPAAQRRRHGRKVEASGVTHWGARTVESKEN